MNNGVLLMRTQDRIQCKLNNIINPSLYAKSSLLTTFSIVVHVMLLARYIPMRRKNKINFSCHVYSEKEEVITPALKLWRETVSACRTPAQLYMCLTLLADCIAWAKSIMKVVSGVIYNQGAACQRCQTTLHSMWYNNCLKKQKHFSTFRPEGLRRLDEGL